jgi:hypothetical protein
MAFNDVSVKIFDHLEVSDVLWSRWVIGVLALYVANTHVAKWTYIYIFMSMSIAERLSRRF